MKKYIWAFPFCGGIISIIGVLTPVASSGSYFSIWIWGLIYSRLSINPFDFISEEFFLFIGVSVSIAIITLALVLIITGYWYRREYLAERDLGKLWAVSGIFLLAAIIVSLVSLDFYIYEDFSPFGIWDFLDAGFGAMGPIIGSILAIGTGIYVSVTEREQRIRRKTVPISDLAPKNLCPHCGRPVSLNASFCSKCGEVITKDTI
jgi:hypothetical protein